MAIAQCPFCGAELHGVVRQCPKCRETLESAHTFPGREKKVLGGGREMRRGMMWMWLAALLYYFAGGYSPLKFPLPEVSHVLTDYLLPFVFLGGMGMIVFGLFKRARG